MVAIGSSGCSGSTGAENMGGQRGQSPLHFAKWGGRAPPLFTMFNRLLLINNTYFIKLCLFYTDFS